MVGRGGQGVVSGREVGPGASGGEDELIFLLALRSTPGVGDRSVNHLLDSGKSGEWAWGADGADWRRITGRAQPGGVGRPAGLREARELLQRCRDDGVQVVGRGLPGYPKDLLHFDDPPPVLFLKGRFQLIQQKSVAVVGTRKASAPGRRFAESLGRELSCAGFPVVSGLALGIDAAAHRGALDGPGGTVAVLGTGVDQVHPPSHRRLQAAVVESGGLLVSEFLPNERARSHHFPRRNRILAGLSQAVVVVEAGRRSGALITVDHALDLGRDVYAVPGPVEWSQSRGTNALLGDGAIIVTSPGDLLAKLGAASTCGVNGVGAGPDGAAGAADPLGILEVLATRPLTTDVVTDLLDAPASRVLAELTELELDGWVVRSEDGWHRADR